MKNIIKILNQIDYKKIIWILAISETIHNIEEAVWMPAFSQSAGMWQPHVGKFEFRFAIVILTLIFYGIIYYFTRQNNKFVKYLMCGLLVVIIFNVFIPHFFAAIFLGRYAPGLASGILLNIPAVSYLLWRGFKEGIFDKRMLLVGGLGFVIVVFPILTASFVLGKFIGSIFS